MKCLVCGGTGYILAKENDDDAVEVNHRFIKFCPNCSAKREENVCVINVPIAEKNLKTQDMPTNVFKSMT